MGPGQESGEQPLFGQFTPSICNPMPPISLPSACHSGSVFYPPFAHATIEGRTRFRQRSRREQVIRKPSVPTLVTSHIPFTSPPIASYNVSAPNYQVQEQLDRQFSNPPIKDVKNEANSLKARCDPQHPRQHPYGTDSELHRDRKT